ncbi:pH-response regulator protein palC [Golovinomyces cichoracearum]|uniref:pH-response regulator protein palC n=1 Tax=Golovinomyces cichoracearum TaxID=62708 RepID=A0A420IFY6_9PEZI|nr:pH-response regulator protein palC [Golovinomyces cichoracearum]
MPYSFTLPTTSSFAFSQFFSSDTHPSLPLAATTSRGVLRDTLKKHKRLPPAERASHLSSVLLSLENYIPYLTVIDRGLGSQLLDGNPVDVILKSTPIFKWRPTLSDNPVLGREIARIEVNSLEYEIYFTLSTLAYTHTLLSRSCLNPLYSLSTALPSLEQRTLAITTATKNLLLAGSIHEYLSTCCEQLSDLVPCIDLSQSTFKALSSLALAEATLLAVLKDDPYPALVVQDRNKMDKEWMIKSPEIPKVRANLFARLCLAAAEHTTNGLSLLNNVSSKGEGMISPHLLKYMEGLRKTSRGKACRFFAIGAELDGQIGTALAWLQAGMYELGIRLEDDSMKSLKKIKKGWEEKKEQKRIEKGTHWGTDAGSIEEERILDFMESKWSKINDTINAQIVPPIGPLMATMPLGRDIYSLKKFDPTSLDASVLLNLKSLEYDESFGLEKGSDEEDERKVRNKASPHIQSDYSERGNYY